MPIFLIIFAFAAIGGVACAASEHDKRVKEAAQFRKTIAELEAELERVKALYGRLSSQYRAVADELMRMQQRYRAAA